MTRQRITILGVNGAIGQEAAKAFVAAGWDVTGMARTDKARLPGVRFVAGDANSVSDMREAIGDSGVVLNALNLPYVDWYGGRKEALMARVLDAMGTSGKTMLLPGTIYNYSASDRVVTPDLPQIPQTPRGAIRVRVEQMFRGAAERGDIQMIVLHAGDFFSPGGIDWFDHVMLRDLAKGRFVTVGTPGTGHSWAYLPDLARAFEALASLRSTFGAFENFHFAGHFVTPEQMASAIRTAIGAPLRSSAFPLWSLKIIGLVDPLMREVGKMDYLWRNEMELQDLRLDGLLGRGFGTPFEAAVAAKIAPRLATLPGRVQLPAAVRI